MNSHRLLGFTTFPRSRFFAPDRSVSNRLKFTKLLLNQISPVSADYILTGAHCFVGYTKIADMKLLVGDHNITNTGETKYERQYDVSTIRVHELFNKDSTELHHDIALVKTTTPIKFNRGVGPACLPPATWNVVTFFDTKPLLAAGWGTLG